MQALSLKRNRLRVAGYGAFATVAAIALGAGIGAAGAAGHGDSMPRGSKNLAPASVVSVLGGNETKQTRALVAAPSDDVLAMDGVDGIDPSTVRFLGEGGGSRFWVATDKAGNICVLTMLTAQGVYASGCNTPEAVEKNGLSIGAFDDPAKPGHRDITALLLPDSAQLKNAAASRSDTPWATISPNLVVADTSRIESGKTYRFDRVAKREAAVVFVLD